MDGIMIHGRTHLTDLSVCVRFLCSLFQRELGRKLEIPVQEFVGKFRYKQNLNAKRRSHSQPC